MTDPETRAIPVDVAPDVAELCKSLNREAGQLERTLGAKGSGIKISEANRMREAATALETLAAENARLREAMDNIKYEAGRDKGGLVHLRRCISAQFAALSPVTQVKESGRAG